MKRMHWWGVCVPMVVAVGLILGCKGDKDDVKKPDQAKSRVGRQNEQLFRNAVGQLNSLEQFPDSRETLRTVTSRLDRWIQAQRPLEGWQSDEGVDQVRAMTLDAKEKLLTLDRAAKSAEAAASPDAFMTQLSQLSVAFSEAGVAMAALAQSTQFPHFLIVSQQFQGIANLIEQNLVAADRIGAEQVTLAVRRQLDTYGELQVAELAGELERYAERLDLEQLDLVSSDAANLEQAIWLRDIATWVTGDEPTDLDKATALFDWTMRNIQPTPPMLQDPRTGQALPLPLQLPWQTLLAGQGTEPDRAWIFMLLLRQIGIDSAMLVAQDPSISSAVLAVGVLIDNEIYLYDTTLAIPLPAPGGLKLDEDGCVTITPLTLAQAGADDAVFEPLRETGVLSPLKQALLQSRNFQAVGLLVPVSPAELSQRMALIQSRMAADQKAVLSLPKERRAEIWSGVPGVAYVELWRYPLAVEAQGVFAPGAIDRMLRPYQMQWNLAARESMWEEKDVLEEADGRMAATISEWKEQQKRIKELEEAGPGIEITASESPLWKGRACYFAGPKHFSGQKSAASYYQDANWPTSRLMQFERGFSRQMRMARVVLEEMDSVLAEMGDSPDATAMPPGAAKPITRRELESQRAMVAQRLGEMQDDFQRNSETLTEMKILATYWSGVLAAQQGDYASAIDFLNRRLLQMFPRTRFSGGALYNLGRVYEAQGQADRAIRFYLADLETQSAQGNLMRAALLAELSGIDLGITRQSEGETPQDAEAAPEAEAVPESPPQREDEADDAPQPTETTGDAAADESQ